MAVPLQMAAAAAATIFRKWLKAEMFLLRASSLSIVKVLRGLSVLRGPWCSKVHLAGPIVTTSLFSSGALFTLTALIKEGPDRRI